MLCRSKVLTNPLKLTTDESAKTTPILTIGLRESTMTKPLILKQGTMAKGQPKRLEVKSKPWNAEKVMDLAIKAIEP